MSIIATSIGIQTNNNTNGSHIDFHKHLMLVNKRIDLARKNGGCNTDNIIMIKFGIIND